MKKTLSLILVLSIILAITVPLTVRAEATSGIYTYEVSGGNATITGCDINASGEISIPATLDGYPVAIIGALAFMSCSSLTSITIPDSVTNIWYGAFYGCSALTSIIIPNSVTSIGDYAFCDCSALTSILLPNSVISIGNRTFYYCSSLTTITIPNNIASIGDYAFCDCSALTSILLPNSVKSIGEGAFYYCSSLTSVTIPSSVASIGRWSFDSCSSLTSITIPNSVTSIGDRAFEYCSLLTSITIPNSVTNIWDSAFKNCSSLVAIDVDSNNTNYSSEDGVLFNKNKSKLLKYPEGKSCAIYIIPSSVTSNGFNAFEYCSLLTSITIPNSVTSIGSIFYGCSALTDIDVDSNNPYYSSEDGVLFNKNKSILLKYPEGKSSTKYIIPNGVTTIADGFRNCSSLTSITIPNSVTRIDNIAFYGCSSLIDINVDIDNPNFSSEDGVLFNKNRTELLKYPDGKSSTIYIIPNGVTSVGDFDFWHCSFLKSITIPNSVTSIGVYAFNGCNDLTIYGTYGSYAQSYANENDISFVATSYIYPQIETYGFTDNTFSAAATVHNYTATDTNSTVLVALYDADSTMIGCEQIDATLVANADNTVNFSFDVSSVPSSYTVKLFVWDSTAKLQPLTDIAIAK